MLEAESDVPIEDNIQPVEEVLSTEIDAAGVLDPQSEPMPPKSFTDSFGAADKEPPGGEAEKVHEQTDQSREALLRLAGLHQQEAVGMLTEGLHGPKASNPYRDDNALGRFGRDLGRSTFASDDEDRNDQLEAIADSTEFVTERSARALERIVEALALYGARLQDIERQLCEAAT